MSFEKDITHIKQMVESPKRIFKAATPEQMSQRPVVDPIVECEDCGRPAEVNVQSLMHTYKITRNGGYESYEEVGDAVPGLDDQNYLWCKECALKHGYGIDF